MRPDFYWSMVYWSQELRQYLGRRKQYVFYVGASVVGLVCYAYAFGAITRRTEFAATYSGLVLTLIVFWCLARIFESNPDTQKLRPIYHRGQSYLFMAGPILMPVLFNKAWHVWHYHGAELSSWVWSWWWFLAGLGLIWVFGVLFRLVDEGRYTGNAASMLKSPSKWWLNKWQMPACMALVAVTVVPTWWVASPERPWTIALVVICAVLAAIDGLRKLDVYEQHVQWDAVHFKRVWQG